jgi:LysR family glycine cleavage system transcriptional activator
MGVTSHLRSLQALETAVRTGSLTAAGEQLGITPAAVGQRIKALEEYLGAELLLRSRAGLRPSPALAEALPYLKQAFADLAIAADALELQRGEEVHVSCPPDFCSLWLEPRLPSFRSAFPRVRFCLNGEGDAPLRLERADCRIEFGGGGGEPLFPDYVLPIGTPLNVDRTAAMPVESRLEGFPLLHVDLYRDDSAALDWQQWIKREGLSRTAPERGMRFRRLAAALDSVLADAGFALAGVALLGDAIGKGRLAFPYPRSAGCWTAGQYRATFRADVARRAPIRAFRDWLLKEAASTRNWLAEFSGSPLPP